MQEAIKKARENKDDRAVWQFLNDCLVQTETIFSFFPPSFHNLQDDIYVYLELFTECAGAPDNELDFIKQRCRKILIRYCNAKYRPRKAKKDQDSLGLFSDDPRVYGS